jgi:hypothetical protein
MDEGKELGIDAFSFECTIAGGDRHYAEMHAQATGEAPLDEAIVARAEGEHEPLIEILASLWEDKRQIFSVNLPIVRGCHSLLERWRGKQGCLAVYPSSRVISTLTFN